MATMFSLAVIPLFEEEGEASAPASIPEGNFPIPEEDPIRMTRQTIR